MEVYDYIKNESIDRIMLSKLTKKELYYVKENISKLELSTISPAATAATLPLTYFSGISFSV